MLGLEDDAVTVALEALDGGLVARVGLHQRHDDVVELGAVLTADQHEVAVADVGADHALAPHAECEQILATAGQRAGRDRQVAFAILLIGASYMIGQLTAGQDVKIIKDLGLSATSMFGLFIAVFIGIGLVSKEVERRSIYSLLAKPISRYQLVIGKYCGLTLTLAVNVAVMAAAIYVVLAYMAWGAPPGVRAAWDAPVSRTVGGTPCRALKARMKFSTSRCRSVSSRMPPP